MVRSFTMLIKVTFFTALLFSLGTTGVLAEQENKDGGQTQPAKVGSAAPAAKGLQQRIDFGNAQILGQSIKSGAVYLMHRKKSDIKNMLEVRKHYREEIKEDFGLERTAISQRQTGPNNLPKQ